MTQISRLFGEQNYCFGSRLLRGRLGGGSCFGQFPTTSPVGVDDQVARNAEQPALESGSLPFELSQPFQDASKRLRGNVLGIGIATKTSTRIPKNPGVIEIEDRPGGDLV